MGLNMNIVKSITTKQEGSNCLFTTTNIDMAYFKNFNELHDHIVDEYYGGEYEGQDIELAEQDLYDILKWLFSFKNINNSDYVEEAIKQVKNIILEYDNNYFYYKASW